MAWRHAKKLGLLVGTRFPCGQSLGHVRKQHCSKWLCAAGTFHSVGCQIIRRHVARLGDTGREVFAIFDQDDTKNVMKLALRKHLKLHKDAPEQPAEAEAGAEAAAEADTPENSQVPEWVSHLVDSELYT